MKIIGLTGGICSGKSTVSNIIKDQGFYLIDCDLIARNLYKSSDFTSGIIKLFGEKIITEGQLDKRKLSIYVFSDKEQLDKLNKYVHPFIFDEIKRQIREGEKQNQQFIFIDAPVLFESGLEKVVNFDEIIVVSISQENQIKRLKIRNPEKSDKEIEDILSRQIKDTERKENATIIIDNNDSVEHLNEKVFRILKDIHKNHQEAKK